MYHSSHMRKMEAIGGIQYYTPSLILLTFFCLLFFHNFIILCILFQHIHFSPQGSLKKKLDIKISLSIQAVKTNYTTVHTDTLVVRAQLEYAHRNENAGLTPNLIKSKNKEKRLKAETYLEGLRTVKIHKTIRCAGN